MLTFSTYLFCSDIDIPRRRLSRQERCEIQFAAVMKKNTVIANLFCLSFLIFSNVLYIISDKGMVVGIGIGITTGIVTTVLVVILIYIVNIRRYMYLYILLFLFLYYWKKEITTRLFTY